MTPFGRPFIYLRRNPQFLQLLILRSIFISVFIIILTLVLINIGNPSDSVGSEPLLPVSPLPNVLYSFLGDDDDGINANAPKSKPMKLAIRGEPSSYFNILPILQNTSNSKLITELHLSYIQINDPKSFSESLQDFPNLRSLILEHVKLPQPQPWDFNFTQVFLPQLGEFHLDFDIGFRDQYTDYMKELSEERIQSLLFYEKNNNSSSNTVGRKLATENVQVSLSFDGWSTLSLKKVSGSGDDDSYEVILGLYFADEILQDLVPLVKINSLTMTECNVSLSSLPKDKDQRLNYLNLYRVSTLDGDIATYFQSIEEQNWQLNELYLEIKNATVKLAKIPKSVKTLAIGDIKSANYKSSEDILEEVETLGMSFPLDLDILDNFNSIFRNVKKVGVFEPTHGTQHSLLKNILKTNASWVLFEGFERTQGKVLESLTEVEKEVEELLESFKVLKDERNFLLFRNEKTNKWFQSELKKEEKLKFRYQLLGWDKYITWETFSSNF